MRATDIYVTDSTGDVVQADSKEEAMVAEILEERDVWFEMHKPIFGGRDVQGGYILDFLIKVPTDVVVEVNSDYFHSGQMSDDEQLRISRIKELYNIVVELWSPDLVDKQTATAVLAREAGI